jgi:hypothetical protein
MRTGRLYKLANFLESLPEKNFEFSSVVEKKGDPTKPVNECGTIACAIGWTPRIFPRIVEYVMEHNNWYVKPANSAQKFDDYVDTAEFGFVGSYLFGISDKESGILFSMLNTDYHNFRDYGARWNKDTNLADIRYGATPKQVAQSIRNFIKWKKAGNSL